ncbi:MAG: hypothetical protein ACJASM_001253 [Salibacteraceae bacterium]|jgi:uncharacterized protein YkwD/outer membrane protein OmpA-like peptidoglycan-associated protein
MKVASIIFCLSLQLLAQGQSSGDKLDYNILKSQYLEHLVKLKIDEFRKQKGLVALRSDSLLILPACDHTDFMKSRNELTHFQARGGKHTPQRRFEFYEINGVLAGENVEYLPINTLLKVNYHKGLIDVKTYEDLAQAIAQGWRHSKPHYANILTKEYTITAVCIKVDIKKNVLWATQVFGQIIGKHSLTKTNASFPFETVEIVKKKSSKKPKQLIEQTRYSHGLKKPKDFLDCPRELNNKLDLSNLKLQVTRDKVLLCVYDLNKIKRLFIGSKDGLAVELISFNNAYGCSDYVEKPNRRNDLSQIDGQLLKPVYRNAILNQIAELEEENRQRKKERGVQRCNYIELGSTPISMSGKPMEARLYYVKNKNLCTEIEFFGYCGQPLKYKPTEIPLHFDLPQSKYIPKADTFALNISIGFEKSSSQIKSAQIDSLIQQIKGKELEVKSVKIEAFASVEGTRENNQDLFENRTKELILRLKKFQQREIIWSVNATENWSMFYDQIIGTDWFYLNSLSKSKIRATVNDSKNQIKLEPLLSAQRTAEIRIVVVPELSDKWIFTLAQSEWNSLISATNFQSISQETIENLEVLQNFFYSNFNVYSSSKQQWIMSIYVSGYSQKTSLLRYRQLLFQIKNNSTYDPIETVELLKKLNRDIQSSEADYNTKSIIATNAEFFDEKTKIPLIKSLMKQVEKDDLIDNIYGELELWYHVEMANLVFGSQNKKGRSKAEHSLAFIREFYITASSTTMDSIDLAEFFMLFDKEEWAIQLIKPIAFDSVPNAFQKVALDLYLRNCMSADLEGRNTEIQLTVLNAYEELGQRKWCRLFFTPCAVSYTVFEYPMLRSLYCEACKEFVTSSADE